MLQISGFLAHCSAQKVTQWLAIQLKAPKTCLHNTNQSSNQDILDNVWKQATHKYLRYGFGYVWCGWTHDLFWFLFKATLEKWSSVMFVMFFLFVYLFHCSIFKCFFIFNLGTAQMWIVNAVPSSKTFKKDFSTSTKCTIWIKINLFDIALTFLYQHCRTE